MKADAYINTLKVNKGSRKWSILCGLICIVFSFICAVLLGLPLAAFSKKDESFLEALFDASKMMYIFFTAAISVGGILMILFQSLEEYAIQYGAGMYYGTIAVSSFLSNYIPDPPENRILIAFTIVSLISYIVWLKFHIQADMEETIRKQRLKIDRLQAEIQNWKQNK